jgi:hypothetical protein
MNDLRQGFIAKNFATVFTESQKNDILKFRHSHLRKKLYVTPGTDAMILNYFRRKVRRKNGIFDSN